MARQEKFALVTGCGQGGIGEALVKEYARAGLHPIATILPIESSEHLDQAGIDWFYLDVTKEDSILEFKAKLEKLCGGYLDILVNNAGIGYTMPAVDSDVTEIQRMFDVNLFGPMRMVRHFHPMLIKAGGTIVNIGSIGGIVPYVYGSSYNATKAGLHHWSNTLRVEMAPLGVKVLTIISGEVATNILKRDHGRELPAGSYFAPLAEEFKQHVRRVPETTDRFTYAGKVVGQSLRTSFAPWFWFGKQTLIIRLYDMLLWRGIWDGMFSKWFHFDKLKKANLERLKQKD